MSPCVWGWAQSGTAAPRTARRATSERRMLIGRFSVSLAAASESARDAPAASAGRHQAPEAEQRTARRRGAENHGDAVAEDRVRPQRDGQRIAVVVFAVASRDAAEQAK